MQEVNSWYVSLLQLGMKSDILWHIDLQLSVDSVNSSHCYVVPIAHACAVMSYNNRRGVAGGILSVGLLQGYMTQLTKFSSVSECRIVEVVQWRRWEC
jgi:hypothetical protein